MQWSLMSVQRFEFKLALHLEALICDIISVTINYGTSTKEILLGNRRERTETPDHDLTPCP